MKNLSRSHEKPITELQSIITLLLQRWKCWRTYCYQYNNCRK